jgi:transposase
VKPTPDITMPELATLLKVDRGVKGDPSNISKFLCAIGYSFEKNTSGVGTRAQRR